METLLLDSPRRHVVFPGMTVTLAARRGRRGRVFLVPRHENDFASVGTVAEVLERIRLPGGGQRRHGRGRLPRHRRAPPATTDDGNLRVEVTAAHRRDPARRAHARAGARVPRRGRGDPRPPRRRRAHPRLPALDLRARRAGRHLRLLARPQLRAEARAAGDARRDRAAREGARRCSASAWPSCRSAAGSATTSRQGAEKQQREYFLRKQMESIRKELGEDEGSVADEYRTKIEEAGHARRRARAGRAGARAGWSAWASPPASRR